MLNTIRGRLLQTGAVAAAALMMTVAAPVQAAPGETTTANASGNTPQPARTSTRSDRRVCVEVPISASRIARRVCRTQAEWDREGGVPRAE
jgi:hypothetical protein